MAEFELSWKTKTAFVVTGVFIGLLVTIQFKSSVPTSSYLTDELEVQNLLVKSYLDDQALLKSKIVTLRQKIDENQQKLSQNKKDGSLDKLQELKSELGLEAAKGAGVEILIDDGAAAKAIKGDEINEFLVNAADLRDIVNAIRTAKPQAIAINDQRIIASTPITSVGNTIMVNNFHLLPPFRIVAIGDPETINQRLSDSNNLSDLLKRIKDKMVKFSLAEKEALTAPVFNGDFRLNYVAEANNQQS